jgi:hypothetical protein
MGYTGGCHCGKVAYEVEGEIDQVTQCNCSICSKRATLLWFVPRANLRLSTPESELSTYTFNKHHIQHKFCPTCGVAPFALATNRDGQPMAAMNARCLEGVDPASLKIMPFDGRSL